MIAAMASTPLSLVHLRGFAIAIVPHLDRLSVLDRYPVLPRQRVVNAGVNDLHPVDDAGAADRRRGDHDSADVGLGGIDLVVSVTLGGPVVLSTVFGMLWSAASER